MHKIIICGCGRVGRSLAETITGDGRSFDVTVIERDHFEAKNLTVEGFKVVEGDGTNREILKKAGILEAEWLAVLTGSDSDNMYIATLAKELVPKIKTAVRVSKEENLPNYLRINVDLLVFPELIGGKNLGEAITKKKPIESLPTVESRDTVRERLSQIIGPLNQLRKKKEKKE